MAAMINRHKWRYGYGRQCYMDKFAALTVDVPWKNGAIDQDTINEPCDGPAIFSLREGIDTVSKDKKMKPGRPPKHDLRHQYAATEDTRHPRERRDGFILASPPDKEVTRQLGHSGM